MNTELTVGGVTVAVTRKPIRSFNLGVYPPDGRVRLSVPMHTSDDAVRLAIIDKLGWIKKQRERHRQQPRQVPRLLASGESHYYLGQRYRLRVIEQRGPAGVVLPDKQTMVLTVPSGATEARRRAVVNAW